MSMQCWNTTSGASSDAAKVVHESCAKDLAKSIHVATNHVSMQFCLYITYVEMTTSNIACYGDLNQLAVWQHQVSSAR